MSVEEMNLSGDMLDEKLITYKRRRVYNENPNSQEVQDSSHTKRKRKARERDIGWHHGKMLNGIKQHWCCNYCGMTRHGGGVTRLKLHLVGHKDVLKCPNVPDQVAEEIAKHLFFKEKEMPLLNLNWKRKKRRKAFEKVGPAHQVEQEEDIVDVDEMESDALESESESDGTEKDLEDDMQRCSLSCMPQRNENTHYEVLKNLDEIMHESNKEYKSDMVAGTNNRNERHAQVINNVEDSRNSDHWKSQKHVLESMPPFPIGKENRDNDGMENSIRSHGVHGCINEAPSPPQAHNTSQVSVGENVAKYQNAFASIINSDKFALLCDLLRNNFRDGKLADRGYIDFGEIDAKMKNGDYEKSPELFSNDVMKVWKNLEHVGQEMVHLAANLASISKVIIENKIGINVLDMDEPIDPYEASYCNHCKYEITNNWGLVSCKDCNISYHASCINPVIHDSASSWYCSACMGKTPSMGITIGTDETNSDKENNAETVEPCITSLYRLCKICGIRADGEREFVVCSHPECPYKYYHTGCLRKNRVVIGMQEDGTCWFCPSCLCRVCRDNKDDSLIVLCDGCDEAYHIYCMDPPCDSVPEGKWYCSKCTKKRRRKSRKTEIDVQSLSLRPAKKNGVVPKLQFSNGTKNEGKKQAHKSMDLLMTAIDAVNALE